MAKAINYIKGQSIPAIAIGVAISTFVIGGVITQFVRVDAKVDSNTIQVVENKTNIENMKENIEDIKSDTKEVLIILRELK